MLATGVQSESTFFVQVLAHRFSQCEADQKKSIYFACQFGELGNGIFYKSKKFKIPEDLRIPALFSELQNSTSKCS